MARKPPKLTLEEFRRMLEDPDVPDERISEYLFAGPGAGPFDPKFRPNPEFVEMDRLEDAMSIGNWWCRRRRRAKFRSRIRNGERLPVLVEEGDSWLQFPFLIDDIIDHLGSDYLIWSCSAAGDTAQNMVFDNPEYMEALNEQQELVSGFVFSAAGNDVLGQDESGNSNLLPLLHKASETKNTSSKLVNKSELARVTARLKEAYEKVIRTVRSDSRFVDLPIIVHGYDYVVPYPGSRSDNRRPLYAERDQWLGKPMAEKEIHDPVVRAEIVEILIDALYEMLFQLASDHEQVHVVDARRTLTKIGDWADEIHGTSDGFALIANRFRDTLDQVVVPKMGRVEVPELATSMPRASSVELSELTALSKPMEEVDPKILGIGNASKFASGFKRAKQKITLHATPELAIGADDSLPYRFLKDGGIAGRAICKLLCQGVTFRGEVGEWFGTGFLIAPNILLTNHHVINSKAVARTARAVFDYYETEPGVMAPSSVFRLNPKRLFMCSEYGELDYCFVWVDGRPQDEFGVVPIWRGSYMAGPRSTANIIHHPNGHAKRTSIKENEVIDIGFGDVFVHYATDTEPGSSGSPVFTDEWRLFALHHASSGELPEEIRDRIRQQTRHDTSILNEGIKTSAIAIDVDRRAAHGSDRVAAREVQSYLAGTDSKTGFFGTLGRDARGIGVEAVVDAYRGAPGDIDVAFWNVEWFNRNVDDKIDDVARIVADLNLDIWAFEETSPQATEELVRYLRAQFGLEFAYAASEPDAPGGRQTTTVMWNMQTVEGRRLEWPERIHKILKLRSDDPRADRFEAVEGKIFDRYPGLFHFRSLNAPNGAPEFDFNLVPIHLKAKSEGAKRRRMAANVLATAVEMTDGTDVAENDWVIGGDFNAELGTGQFDGLMRSGFKAMSAADERGGAVTYLGKTKRSLIDSIFLSPGMRTRAGADDFMIIAQDRLDPGFVSKVSDHRPVMIRLSLAEEPLMNGADDLSAGIEEDFLDTFAEEVQRDPAGVLTELASRFSSDT